MGGVDPTPATHSWTVEALPETILQAAPDNPTNDTEATFAFGSTDTDVTFECALDEAVDDAGLLAVHVAADLHEPDLRRARLRGPRRGLGRQRRPDAGRVPLAGRRRGPAGHDRVEPRRADRRAERHVRLLRRGPQPPVRVRARRPRLHALRLAADLQRPADGRAHLPGPRLRPRGHRPAGDHHLRVGDRRARPARDGDRLRSDQPERQPHGELRLRERRGRRDLRVLARRRPVERLPRAVRPHRPDQRAAQARGPSGRRLRERRRLARGLHLDRRRRHDAADDQLRVRPGCRPPTSSTRASASRSEPGATFECSLDAEPFAACTSPIEFSDLELGDHVVPRPRDGPEGQRRDAGRELRLDDRARHHGARDDAPRAAARDDDRHLGDVQLLLERAGRGVRVRDRRRAVRGLRPADGLHRPDRRRAHLPGARGRPGRSAERRPDARDLHLDDHRAARHDPARDADPVRPAREDRGRGRVLHPQRRGRRDLRVRARRRAAGRVRVAGGVHRPRARRPHLHRGGDRPGRQRGRDARHLHVDDRGAAGDDDRDRAGRDERERDRPGSPSPPTRPASSTSARSTASRRRSAARRRPTRA